MVKKIRCDWCSGELMIKYHDEEWGNPIHDDKKLFEFLILEGAQAGLSWSTVVINYLMGAEHLESENIVFLKRFLKSCFLAINSDTRIQDHFFNRGILEKVYNLHVSAIEAVKTQIAETGYRGSTVSGERQLRNHEIYINSIKTMLPHLHSYASSLARMMFTRTDSPSEAKITWGIRWYRHSRESSINEQNKSYRANKFYERARAAYNLHLELRGNENFYRSNANTRNFLDTNLFQNACFYVDGAMGLARNLPGVKAMRLRDMIRTLYTDLPYTARKT